ncbi:MAG TPA: hypothetical protein PLD10_24630 [Rhodopila sp.]|nr:hypothetical protein [Rhodopila sp.]
MIPGLRLAGIHDTLSGVTPTIERIIEAVLFLTPFLAFIAWRLVLASVVPPPVLVLATTGFAAVLLGTLIWLHHLDARNTTQAYVPAQVRNGDIIPGHAVRPRPAAPPAVSRPVVSPPTASP